MNDASLQSVISFAPDFRSARTGNGNVIEFTNFEAKALGYLAANPKKVLTRAQILDAVSETGSDKNDRNIDFLINRIRKKLNDDAKSPKFIASRYGEGYVWLSDWQNAPKEIDDPFLIIGPFRGHSDFTENNLLTMKIAEALKVELERQCAPHQRILIEPNSVRSEVLASTGKSYAIELSLVADGQRKSCVAAVKASEASGLIAVARFEVHPDMPPDVEKMHDFCSQALARIWKRKATRAEDVPLPIAMHTTSYSQDDNAKSWRESDKRLKELRKTHPQDDELKIMYAAHLHSKYVLLGPELFYKGTDTCAQDEAEIERLALEALEFSQSIPEYSAITAKLLYFLKSGYENLASDLAEKAIEESPKVASSLAIIGQMRCFQGRFEEAWSYLEQANQLAKRSSDFHVYVLVLQSQFLLAMNDQERLLPIKRELYSVRPATMVFFEPIYTDPDKPSRRARAAVMMLSRKRAQAILKHIFYISGRMFEDEQHRENMMRTPVTLMRRRFGRDVLTDEMRQLLPGLTG